MRKSKKVISRSIGVEIGAICSKYFLKSQHLHYGYWTGDLEVDIANLCIAQDNYVRFLVSHIPPGVNSILDVGCGTGQIAKMLLDAGYQVDCVSPSAYLSNQARQLLGARSIIFECFYEELETPNRYDLILFSESFQYIKPQEALSKTLGLLNKGGYILICDIFKKDAPDRSLLPGGHSLKTFYSLVSQYGLELVEDLDITEQTAPTLDIVNSAFNEVVLPSLDLAQQFFNDRHPLMLKCLKFLYRKKISRINKKYLSGAKTGDNFKKFKSYRLLLYRHANVISNQLPDLSYPCLGAVDSKKAQEVESTVEIGLSHFTRLDEILSRLKKIRLLVLLLAFAIVIVENILSGQKPRELLSLQDGISVIALVGLVLVFGGAFIRLWTQGHCDRQRTIACGPYAIIRHPLYLGSLLVVVGILLQLNDWMNWIIILPVFAIFYGAAIIYEDRSLARKFGKQWQAYSAKTPALIPYFTPRAPAGPGSKWSWKVYLSTSESRITPALLVLPLAIELLLEDFAFEFVLGI